MPHLFMTELRIDTSNIPPKFEALSPNADQSVFESFCLDADPTLSLPTTGSGPAAPGPGADTDCLPLSVVLLSLLVLTLSLVCLFPLNLRVAFFFICASLGAW